MTWFHWALLSALFAGGTAIFAKIGVSGIDSNLATAIRTSIIVLFTWTLVLSTTGGAALFQLNRRTWLFLTLSGLATGLSWICYFRALQLGEASQVAPVDKLSVVFVLIFAALFLHERVSWQHCLGGTLIVAGAILLALKSA